MNVVIYGPQAIHRGRAMELGLQAHGIKASWGVSPVHRTAHLGVWWGHKCPPLIEKQKAIGDYLVMELGYFGDRNNRYMSLGYNGLNGRAQFYNQNMPGDRWAKHGVPVAPWKQGGDYVLVMGQVLGDASLAACPNYEQWLIDACNQAKTYGLPVYYRPHPRAADWQTVKPPTQVLGGSLSKALEGAAAVIAWNSNSLVDAAIAGVPIVACDIGSMAWPVAAHEIGADLVRPDRTQWLHDLAYTQWATDEVASGEAWAHLSQHFAGRELPAMPELKDISSAGQKVDQRRNRRREQWAARQPRLADLGLLKQKVL